MSLYPELKIPVQGLKLLFSLYISHFAWERDIYGQHIEGALKLINYKIYPHALNYSAIHLTYVQLMIDCIESSIYFFPSTQQHRFYNTGLGFIFPFLSLALNCRSIYPTTSLKFCTGCLIVNSNVTFKKITFLIFFPNRLSPQCSPC